MYPPITIGPVALGLAPRVVLSVRDDIDQEEISRCLREGAHIVELRIDQFASHALADIRAFIKRLEGIPLLATIRHKSQGGGWTGTEDDRATLYRGIIPLVDAVDIELDAVIAEQVIVAARNARCTSIGSYHNFVSTPLEDELAYWARTATALRVDICKIAGNCTSEADFRRLARFTVDRASGGVVTIGMGAFGAPSRVLFPALGSLLTYTFLGAPTAPGQLNCDTLLAYLNGLYGQWGKQTVVEEATCSNR